MAIKRTNWTIVPASSTPTENWRYVVIWWYMDPNGKIVEETQWVPNATPSTSTSSTYVQTPHGGIPVLQWAVGWATSVAQVPYRSSGNVVSPMSTADVLWARYQAAYNSGNTNLADAYKTLNQENTAYNRVANQIADYYGALANDVAQREQWLADAKYDVASKLFNDMASQRDYVYGLYGPEGSLTKAINTYYDDMWDYLASEAGREMAYADAMWVQSWASLWMMRAQRNQAYNEAFQRSLQVMQNELEAKQSIAQNLINFMTNLRQEYWDTANTYIISQYQRANDLLNAISESVATTSAQIAMAKLSAWSGWWTQWNEKKSIENMSDMEVLQEIRKQWIQPWKWVDMLNDWSIAVTWQDWDTVKSRVISTWALADNWFSSRNQVKEFLWWGTWAQAWTWS